MRLLITPKLTIKDQARAKTLAMRLIERDVPFEVDIVPGDRAWRFRVTAEHGKALASEATKLL